jgi:hypothetical protein
MCYHHNFICFNKILKNTVLNLQVEVGPSLYIEMVSPLTMAHFDC